MRTACPYCGRALKTVSSYSDDVWGAMTITECELECQCGFKCRYSFGSYEELQLPYWKQEELAMLEGEEE